MGRVVLVNQDLRGRVLDASTQPDGHARESLVRGCTFDINTRFLGDIRGSDFLGNTGPADWSQAQTYGCYWRQNLNLQGSLWPADIGDMHHQPVAEIIRERLATLNTTPTLREKLRAVRDHVLAGGSWDTSKAYWWDGLTDAQQQKLVQLWEKVFAGYPKLEARFADLKRRLLGDGSFWEGSAQWAVTLQWPDGAEVTIDGQNLPDLSEKSRYGLRRWAEAKADAQRPGRHHCFIFAVADPWVPLTVAVPLAEPDAWIGRIAGY